MEIITNRDVLRLANALSVKCDLSIKLSQASQCSSDYLLALYNAVMGELPVGILSDCVTIGAQEHNVMCIIDTLAQDYLHVDLSHITPQNFVAGDPTTIYNLLEILDGLFEFMLDQISNGFDSGDEGDLESDVMSDRPNRVTLNKRYETDSNLDSTTGTAELIALDDKSLLSEHLTDIDESHFVPLKQSTSPDLPDWHDLKSGGSISEHTLESADLNSTLQGDDDTDRTASLLKLANYKETEPKLPSADTLKATYKVTDSRPVESIRDDDKRQSPPLPATAPSEPASVVLERSNKGPAMSVSDVTSEEDLSSVPPSVVLEERAIETSKKSVSSGDSSSSGVDEPDGIPKPVLQEEPTTSGYKPGERLERRQAEPQLPSQKTPAERDWVALLGNLQKTVNESRKIREKYFTTPQSESSSSESRTESHRSSADSLRSNGTGAADLSRDKTRPKSHQRNVRFEDTISTKTAKDLKEFKEVLQREKQLQNIKNKILSDSYRDHLDEVEEAERDKIQPLVRKAKRTERDFRAATSKQRVRKASPKQPSTKRDLAAAAKWKSWQSPTVIRKAPVRRPISPRRRIHGNLELGEHDLLPLLMDEFPGLDLSSVELNNAWKKQFRQIEVLTSRESAHEKSRRHEANKLQEAHRRHHLLTDIMRKEHEHTKRVREAREREAGKREAQRTSKDRRQQSARVRRYYRDYQLQMRARMLKRRTKEERLFHNLFEEGLDIQRSRLRELRKYARDKRDEQQKRQRNEIASLENYYKDQFAILSETLEGEKTQLRVRDKAQTELLRKMKSGLREKMEREITSLQERITRDDEDIYFRELEADRIRRQLQLATYHAKFDSSLAKTH